MLKRVLVLGVAIVGLVASSAQAAPPKNVFTVLIAPPSQTFDRHVSWMS